MFSDNLKTNDKLLKKGQEEDLECVEPGVEGDDPCHLHEDPVEVGQQVDPY